MNMVTKAYFRRGYAYEILEKFSHAIDDMNRVKELQPGHQDAAKALIRLNKAVKAHSNIGADDFSEKILKIKDLGNKYFTQKMFD